MMCRKLPRDWPCIHHWGLEVADREAFVDIVKKHGGEIISKPGAPTLRFRTPDNTIMEVVTSGRLKDRSAA